MLKNYSKLKINTIFYKRLVVTRNSYQSDSIVGLQDTREMFNEGFVEYLF